MKNGYILETGQITSACTPWRLGSCKLKRRSRAQFVKLCGTGYEIVKDIVSQQNKTSTNPEMGAMLASSQNRAEIEGRCSIPTIIFLQLLIKHWVKTKCNLICWPLLGCEKWGLCMGQNYNFLSPFFFSFGLYLNWWSLFEQRMFELMRYVLGNWKKKKSLDTDKEMRSRSTE